MPIVIGFALESEVQSMRFPYYKLDKSEANNYGLVKNRQREHLYLTYIPQAQYDKMKPSEWENTFVMDERNIIDKLSLGI